MSDEIQKVVEELRVLGIDHDVLKSITVIEGEAVNETPLRVGKGRGGLGEVDLPVLRDPRGVPYIPASTIKGATRSLLEAVARAGNYKVCELFNDATCSFAVEFLNYVYQVAQKSRSFDELKKTLLDKQSQGVIAEIASRRHIRDAEAVVSNIMSSIEQVSSVDKLLSVLKQYSPCIICRVFGNQALASKAIFFDVYPVKDQEVKPATRARVAIDRFREAARSGALFEYEFIPPGYKWRFRAELKNIDITACDSDVCKLLRTYLKMFASQGIMFGGMKSVGHGVLRLDPEKTRVVVYVVKDLSLVEEKNITLRELISRW
ncbi:MAG: RAMP superfamily CRISPR-associated protein [Ignisphaera sp.]